jgi:serine protease Do
LVELKRAVLSSLLTFSLGMAGGVVAVRAFPADAKLTLAAQPAHATPAAVTAAVPGDGIADLVDQVKNAVVNIDTVSHRRAPAGQAELFRHYFGEQAPMPPEQEQKGVGSGFVVAADGLIVTNYHVVKGAEKLTVTLADGTKHDGQVIGRDPSTDLALVRIKAKNLTTLKLADPKSLRVGQFVVAVGSPLGLSQTVTSGILSAINRDIAMNSRVDFLQTDAPINPGNSGGPLLNLRGEVIGVNTAIAARGQGIGFAVPVGTLKTVLPQLQAKGQVERAWLGVGIGDLPEDRSAMFYPVEHGVMVGRVEAGGPAEKAGLKAGDVILTLNGQKLQSASQLIKEVGKLPVGQSVDLVVARSGQQKAFKLVLAKMPNKLADAGPGGEE